MAISGKQQTVLDGKAFNERAGVLDGLIHGVVFAQKSFQVLRDIARRDAAPQMAMQEHLKRLGNAEPALAVSESQRGHGVVSDAGGKDSQRAVDRGVRIAADDDLARSPQAVLDDHVMQAAGAGIEHADAVCGGEMASFGQNLRVALRGRRKGVIEDKNDARRIEDFAAAHLLFKHLRDQVGAQIVKHHAVHVGDDDIAGSDVFLAAGLGENFLDHVHKALLPVQVSPKYKPRCSTCNAKIGPVPGFVWLRAGEILAITIAVRQSARESAVPTWRPHLPARARASP